VKAGARERGEEERGAERASVPAAAARSLAPRRLLLRLRRSLAIVGRAAQAIRAERVQMRAMALTYISLFALVPALVVAFSVVQGLTGMDRVATVVHDYLLENLAVGARASIEPYLDRFVRNAHIARAGLVGAALLLWSAYSLLGNVEAAINDLWEVKVRRTFRMRALVYWMSLTLGPLLVAASATVSELARTFLANRELRFLAILAAALLSSLFLSALYLVVPNVRVRLKAAVVGGVAAGIGWEVAKWGFAWVMGKSVRLHAIYGSVAAIPIFLTWLYLSWSIVLFGARLGFVVQNARQVIAGGDGPAARGALEQLAGRILVVVSEAFRAGASAPGADELARRLQAGTSGLEAVEALRRAGLVKGLGGGGLVPGRTPETITLLDVRRAVRGEPSPTQPVGAMVEAFHQADERAEERLRAVSIASLCQPLPDPAPEAAQSTPSGA
jgi:membrane protein